jgi:hypothetical protein
VSEKLKDFMRADFNLLGPLHGCTLEVAFKGAAPNSHLHVLWQQMSAS